GSITAGIFKVAKARESYRTGSVRFLVGVIIITSCFFFGTTSATTILEGFSGTGSGFGGFTAGGVSTTVSFGGSGFGTTTGALGSGLGCSGSGSGTGTL